MRSNNTRGIVGRKPKIIISTFLMRLRHNILDILFCQVYD